MFLLSSEAQTGNLMLFRNYLFIILLLTGLRAFSQQQDVEFHLNAHLFPGKNIVKVKRDFKDPYVWVLAQNNQVYRVNSITLAIDDYTATFAAYNNLQFVDIAGRSQDTVFIATNSTNVLEYKNGAIKLIGASDGIPGTVNSIGIAFASLTNFFLNTNNLLIATDNGSRFYNSDTETIDAQNDNGNSRVYETTWRTETYKDSSAATQDANTQDTIQYQPTIYMLPTGPEVVDFLYEGGKEFGYNINTSLVVYDALYYYNEVYSNTFWGNDQGMFQNFSNYSYYSIVYPYGHYLDRINVNKITNIYGLTSFGSGEQFALPGLLKQNLLIGTDNGFYFSSSIFTSAPDPIRNFSLFHDDELGNIVINDICVNVASTNKPICEDGVWLGAADGLYLVKPDYGAFLNSQTLQAINFQNEPDTLSKINICSGDSTHAIINTSAYTGNNFQWYKNGIELPGQSKDSLTISTPGNYYAVLYDPCTGLHINSNQLQVNITSTPVFSFNYPDTIQQCANTPDTLKTTNTQGYHYRWYTDDVLNGDTTASFVVTQTGKYKVEVSACPNSWVPSKEVQVNLIQLPVPAVTSDKPAYCFGDNATLSVAVPADPSYTINWYNNNAPLASNTNQTSLTTNIPGSYTVAVVNNTVNTDGTTCSETSPAQTVIFNPLPTINVQTIVNITLCEGQTINLHANYNGGTVKWSTGETTDQISVSTSGTYTATVTSPAGCQSDTSITISFFSNPILRINDTTICTYKRQPITLSAPSGFSQYAWNGVTGGQTYQVSQPETVSLTVTDVNGCQATQQVKVTEQCANVYIPNTFTPNGDGINDTWDIEGLESDPTVLVRIYTRYGMQIYESRGYTSPWNGEYGGKKLPAGVYYYIINAKNGTQKFSGSLTVLY